MPEPLPRRPEPADARRARLEQAVAEARLRPRAGLDEGQSSDELAQDALRRRGVRPDPERVPGEDPRPLGLVAAVRYVLSVPTKRADDISSSAGYFLSGLSMFAPLLFVRGHYHASRRPPSWSWACSSRAR